MPTEGRKSGQPGERGRGDWVVVGDNEWQAVSCDAASLATGDQETGDQEGQLLLMSYDDDSILVDCLDDSQWPE